MGPAYHLLLVTVHISGRSPLRPHCIPRFHSLLHPLRISLFYHQRKAPQWFVISSTSRLNLLLQKYIALHALLHLYLLFAPCLRIHATAVRFHCLSFCLYARRRVVFTWLQIHISYSVVYIQISCYIFMVHTFPSRPTTWPTAWLTHATCRDCASGRRSPQ